MKTVILGRGYIDSEETSELLLKLNEFVFGFFTVTHQQNFVSFSVWRFPQTTFNVMFMSMNRNQTTVTVYYLLNRGFCYLFTLAVSSVNVLGAGCFSTASSICSKVDPWPLPVSAQRLGGQLLLCVLPWKHISVCTVRFLFSIHFSTRSTYLVTSPFFWCSTIIINQWPCMLIASWLTLCITTF